MDPEAGMVSFRIDLLFNAAQKSLDGGELFGEVLADGAVFAVHFGTQGADVFLGFLKAGAVLDVTLQAHFVADRMFVREGIFSFVARSVTAIQEVLEAGENGGGGKGSGGDGHENKDGHLLKPGVGDGFEAGLGEQRESRECV
jgi:hypothetical protein